MTLFYLGFILLYALVMFSLLTKWKVEENDAPSVLFPFSIILPFRNEAHILLKTCESLKKISADEIIFCNDHSEDESSFIIRDFIIKHNLKHWKLIDSIGTGKKAAVTSGVNYSSHELIYTTDADCNISNNVIFHMLGKFRIPNVQMVCGPVNVSSGKSFLEGYQKAEWASISLVTNFFFKVNRPLMCSAANMAYRKSAFYEVEGYKNNENISSGDDEYLLKKIAAKYGPQSILYTNHVDALVDTIPTSELFQYLSQRARWAGKWKAHREPGHALTALLFFLFAVVQISSIVLLSGRLEEMWFFFVFWVVKIFVDFLVLGHVMKTYNKNISLIEMISVSVFHPLSVLIIGFISIFVKITWKGRLVLTKV